MEEQKETSIGNSKDGSKEEKRRKRTSSERDIEDSFESSKSTGSDYKNKLEHVKSTLQLYLRKAPIIDLSNEMMLKIVFSMLKFSQADIADLDAARK